MNEKEVWDDPFLNTNLSFIQRMELCKNDIL